ncbi:HD-GYP domain-containing protein [Alkaliphilus crotonatoxidans]
MEKFEVDLNELLMTFSLMLDVAENKPFQHAKKVAYISSLIIKKMGIEEDLEKVIQAAILHDIGVIPAIFRQGNGAFVKAEQSFSKEQEHHATTGWEIAKELPINKEIPEIIKFHHERYDGTGPYGMQQQEIPFLSQVISLADQFELKFDPKRDSLAYRKEITDWLEHEKRKGFQDEVVDTLLRVLEKDRVWFDLGTFDIGSILKDITPSRMIKIDMMGLEKIAKAFAIIVDKKSSFTHQHSLQVSEKAYRMAQQMKYNGLKIQKMKVAGYLHDLGKLVVPNEILDKPGRLTQEEMVLIRKHPYYSKYILKQVKGFEDIAEWASNHHENLLGTGYPEGLSGEQLSEESQIIALCDIHQALVEDRIYRKGMTQQEALAIIKKLIEKGCYHEYIFKEFLHIL